MKCIFISFYWGFAEVIEVIFHKYSCVHLPHYSLYLTYIIYTYSAYIAVICERLYDFYHQTSAGTGHHTRIGVSLFCKLTMSGRVENSNREFGGSPTICFWWLVYNHIYFLMYPKCYIWGFLIEENSVNFKSIICCFHGLGISINIIAKNKNILYKIE